jgi:hypothetical protein
MSVDVGFPDGTVVRGSSLPDRDKDDGWREYGLYLDARWSPSWPAEVIEWEDFGLPASFDDAVQAIEHAFDLARSGKRVEVGCLGGKGRTGTVLACMAILAGVPPVDAVNWVQGNYSPKAIENEGQERWVSRFGDQVQGRR